MPSFPDLPEPISDGSVTLRLGAERDIPEILIAYQDDRHMHERLGLERPPSGAELGRDAERAAIERTAGIHVAMTVLETGVRRVPRDGYITTEVEWRHDRAELGMWLAPQVRGRGLGWGRYELMSSWLLHNTSLERLQLVTEPDNEPMLSTARAAGYVHEGVLRGYTLERGRRVDCAILSLLRGECAGKRDNGALHRKTVAREMTAHSRVKLPAGVRTPFEVYVNGVPQELGVDYRITSGELVFERELVSQKLGPWAWFIGFWGIGTYKRNDEVDVRYEVEGQPTVAHALEIIPPS